MAVNAFSAGTSAHLLKYDSVRSRFPGDVRSSDTLDIGLGPIRCSPNAIPKIALEALGIDIVMECTGIFTDRDKAAYHLEAGKRVLVSAPSRGPT